MKEEKQKFTAMLIDLATGSVEPSNMNATVKALQSAGNMLFDEVERLTGEVTEKDALLVKEKDAHDKLKTKYHEKWGSEDQSGGEEFDKGDEDKPLSEKEAIERLAEMAEKEKENN